MFLAEVYTWFQCISDYDLVYKGGCATENDNGPPKIGSKNDVELKGCHDYCQRTDTCQFYEYNTGMLANYEANDYAT